MKEANGSPEIARRANQSACLAPLAATRYFDRQVECPFQRVTLPQSDRGDCNTATRIYRPCRWFSSLAACFASSTAVRPLRVKSWPRLSPWYLNGFLSVKMVLVRGDRTPSY